jgi:hypothetical protein
MATNNLSAIQGFFEIETGLRSGLNAGTIPGLDDTDAVSGMRTGELLQVALDDLGQPAETGSIIVTPLKLGILKPLVSGYLTQATLAPGLMELHAGLNIRHPGIIRPDDPHAWPPGCIHELARVLPSFAWMGGILCEHAGRLVTRAEYAQALR